MNVDVTICFEMHVELSTRTKLFCPCPTDPDAPSNSNICPICTGQPGTLPVLNRKAVEYSIRAGLALNCNVKTRAFFARKNYFYPDLPKGYQISQYELPFSTDGFLEITGDDGEPYRVGIRRVHLEEDAGKLVHPAGTSDDSSYSLVDFNRSGVPLLEIVGDHTRNPLRSLKEARQYLEKMKQIMQYIGVSRCRMEKGELRCDANISIREKGTKEFGHRVEMKNMASFKLALEALDYEIKRQSKILQSGAQVEQETRLYDESNKETLVMRGKEDAPDYRYFPDPDLMEIELDQKFIEKVRKDIPELPDQKMKRLMDEFDLPKADAKILTRDKDVSDYFSACVPFCQDKKKLGHWIVKELFKLLNASYTPMKECPVSPKSFARLVDLVSHGDITDGIGRIVLVEMFTKGDEPDSIIAERNLRPIQDTHVLDNIVAEVVKENPDAIRKVMDGNAKPIAFLVGQVMKRTEGKADPKTVGKIIKAKYFLT